MNTYSNMIVIQSGNEYRIYTPQKICVAYITLPPDGQYIKDSKVIDIICKSLAHRWGVIKK